MNQYRYTIKKSLIIPLGVDAALLVFLLVVAVTVAGSALETGIFTIFLIPTVYLFLESLIRRIEIDEKGLSIRKLSGSKRLPWESITHVGGLEIKNKSYVLLTTVAGFFIISNAYGNFQLLTEKIISHVASERVEDAARNLAVDIPSGIAGTALAWAAAFLMTGIIFLKLYPFFNSCRIF